jgi:predicted pyridoxine 5'-phosphate oxidase superfamily flavin-nucleotide-binding protein
MTNYFDIAFSPETIALQEEHGSREGYERAAAEWPSPDGLDAQAIEQITARNSFYMATTSSTGWPYVQHRGGDTGFVKVLSPNQLGWVERNGNRQYVGTGNIDGNGRVSMIFMDYPARTRLKIFGTANYVAEPDEALLEQLGASGMRNDGAIIVDIAAYDWNCPKYITQRFTADEVRAATAPLHERIAELEARIAEG